MKNSESEGKKRKTVLIPFAFLQLPLLKCPARIMRFLNKHKQYLKCIQ